MVTLSVVLEKGPSEAYDVSWQNYPKTVSHFCRVFCHLTVYSAAYREIKCIACLRKSGRVIGEAKNNYIIEKKNNEHDRTNI